MTYTVTSSEFPSRAMQENRLLSDNAYSNSHCWVIWPGSLSTASESSSIKSLLNLLASRKFRSRRSGRWDAGQRRRWGLAGLGGGANFWRAMTRTVRFSARRARGSRTGRLGSGSGCSPLWWRFVPCDAIMNLKLIERKTHAQTQTQRHRKMIR